MSPPLGRRLPGATFEPFVGRSRRSPAGSSPPPAPSSPLPPSKRAFTRAPPGCPGLLLLLLPRGRRATFRPLSGGFVGRRCCIVPCTTPGPRQRRSAGIADQRAVLHGAGPALPVASLRPGAPPRRSLGSPAASEEMQLGSHRRRKREREKDLATRAAAAARGVGGKGPRQGPASPIFVQQQQQSMRPTGWSSAAALAPFGLGGGDRESEEGSEQLAALCLLLLLQQLEEAAASRVPSVRLSSRFKMLPAAARRKPVKARPQSRPGAETGQHSWAPLLAHHRLRLRDVPDPKLRALQSSAMSKMW